VFETCSVQVNALFSTLTLVPVFRDYVVFCGDRDSLTAAR